MATTSQNLEIIDTAPTMKPAFKKKAYKNAYSEDNGDNLDDPATRARLDPNQKAPVLEPVLDADGNPELPAYTPEEETYKKRYGDLRTFQQRKDKEYTDELNRLRGQLNDATKQEIKFPKTEEEVAEWAAKYPDVAAIIETIASKKIIEQRKEVDTRLELVESMRTQNERERAENKIRQKHADFDDLKADPAFHEWAEAQPKWVKDSLYVNDNDPDSVSRAIDLYKFDKGAVTKKAATQNNREAAQNTRVNTSKIAPAPSSDSGNNKIYESDIKKLTPKQFAAMEEQIDDARREGRLVYDVTAGAR